MTDWQQVYAAFRSSGLNKTTFYRTRLHEFFKAGADLPKISVLYEQFNQIEKTVKAQEKYPRARLVRVVSGNSSVTTSIEPTSGSRALDCTESTSIGQVPVQLDLPGGSRLTFYTSTPEKLALSLFQMSIGR